MTTTVLASTLAAAAGEVGEAGFNPVALLFGVFLLFANGFFVAAEIALLAARRARIEELAEEGDPRARIALASLQELSLTFSGAQLGITMASLGLGAVAEPAVASLVLVWLEPLGLPTATAPLVAFALALSLVVFLHMVIGEMVPKNLALADAEAVSLRVSRLFRVYIRLLRPLIALLNATANVLVRLTGTEPIEELGLVHTPDELQLALRESRRHGTLAPADARVMSAALGLGEIDAGAAMTPRVDLVTVSATATTDEILEVAARTGYTRLPVVDGDLDHVVGVVHVKDLLIAEDHELRGRTAAELQRPISAVPESRDLDHLLREMRSERNHVALVVDEYGGTAGVLSLEDVLEELVGEIADEFDAEEVPGREAGATGAWVVPGTLRRDELERLSGCVLPEGESETVSGVIAEDLGRLPRRGDTFTSGVWTLRVLTVEGRRAGQVEVVRAADETDAADTEH
jgi:CBS domain containing-hemolysin-like protein